MPDGTSITLVIVYMMDMEVERERIVMGERKKQKKWQKKVRVHGEMKFEKEEWICMWSAMERNEMMEMGRVGEEREERKT